MAYSRSTAATSSCAGALSSRAGGHDRRAPSSSSRLHLLLMMLLPLSANALQPPSLWPKKAAANSAASASEPPSRAPTRLLSLDSLPTSKTVAPVVAADGAPPPVSCIHRRQSGGQGSSGSQGDGAPRMRLAHRAGSSARMGAPTGWAAARRAPPRAPHASCSLLGGLSDSEGDRPTAESFSEGQEVVVSQDVNFLHVPGHKGGFNAKGSAGTVLKVYLEPNLSPNRKIKVQFSEPKKWIGHFEPWEIEAA